MTVGAMKGITVPVKKGIASLMKMASSMLPTTTMGMVRDLKQIATMMKIASVERMLVTTKSLSAMVVRSFVSGPSPVIMPPLS